MCTGKISTAETVSVTLAHLMGWLLVKLGRGKRTTALKITEETTSESSKQLNVFSSTLHLMHDIKNSISDTIVISTNIDIPDLKCSTGTDTELNCCSGKFRIRFRLCGKINHIRFYLKKKKNHHLMSRPIGYSSFNNTFRDLSTNQVY